MNPKKTPNSILYSLLFATVLFINSCNNPTNNKPVEMAISTPDTLVKEGIRGVWLTNVASKALLSKDSLVAAVQLCEQTGINAIFVVTWNKAMTTYPSKIMKDFTGVEIDPTIEAGFDPLKLLIEEAHKRNIKVVAWFEFGFSTSYNQKGGILISKKPNWAAKDVNGKLVTKNGFEWMNGFMPEVQDFMLSLIMEVVTNYDVDGIQGDDRLPAMPSESGYDKFTVDLYKSQHKGTKPPKDSKDTAWVKWRANILNEFGKKIYQTVKAAKPTCIVSMAPSIFPWSLEEYLQDWPTWVSEGYCDLICPQLYRQDSVAYQKILDPIVTNQIASQNLHKFYPGILLQVSTYNPNENFLGYMLDANRKAGINGEVFFFYEGIKKYPDFFKKRYSEKIKFPKLF